MAEELETWTYKICAQCNFGLVVYRTVTDFETVQPGSLRFDPQWERIFLFPKACKLDHDLSFNNIKPIEWGWIDITPGGLIQTGPKQVIRMTAICAKGEGAKAPMWNAIEKFRKQIQNDAQAGVVGKSEKTGGISDYREIWHTASARQKHAEGILWKQRPEFNSTFHPKK